MRIVITGAAGFIGSNLARLFLERGAEVFGLVRPGSSHREALPVHERFRLVDWELGGSPDWIRQIGQADGFFHIAWGGVNREEIDSPQVQEKNVAGSLDCVRAAAELGCSVFMDAGSRVEYGLLDGTMEESRECCPINEYGKAKLQFYREASVLCGELGLSYYHLRFFSVYGYGDHPWSIISTLVRDLRQDKKVALSACRHQWNFMYIEDAAEAVYQLYCQAQERRWAKQVQTDRMSAEHALPENMQPQPSGCIVNIASDDTRPLHSFVEEIHQIVGGRGELDYGAFKQAKEGALSICPDISRLKELTAGRWRERYTFRQGIEEIIRLSLSEQES